jgi:GTP cyclohydrolase I
VGYPAGRIGLSKPARVVELFARRPQAQERMTKQIADWLAEYLASKGVGVMVRAEHLHHLAGQQTLQDLYGGMTVTQPPTGSLATGRTLARQ